MQTLQQPRQVRILYDEIHQFRQVRLNEPHPPNVKPSWHGDSVGHYKGELIIDTVAVKTDRPFAMIDLFCAPYAKALHVIERYRLLDYQGAKDGLERDAKENYRPEGDLSSDDNGKWLQIQLTVEDDGALVLGGKEPKPVFGADLFHPCAGASPIAYGGLRQSRQ
jgi:hypothetical protein